jgi:hypothetical protein
LNRYYETFPSEAKDIKRGESQLSKAFKEVQATLKKETKRVVESVL